MWQGKCISFTSFYLFFFPPVGVGEHLKGMGVQMIHLKTAAAQQRDVSMGKEQRAEPPHCEAGCTSPIERCCRAGKKRSGRISAGPEGHSCGDRWDSATPEMEKPNPYHMFLVNKTLCCKASGSLSVSDLRLWDALSAQQGKGWEVGTGAGHDLGTQHGDRGAGHAVGAWG